MPKGIEDIFKGFGLELVCQFTLKCSSFVDLMFEISLLLKHRSNTTTDFGFVKKVLHLNQIVVPKIITSDTNVANDSNNLFHGKINNSPSFLCSIKKSFKSLGEESCTSLMETFEPLSDSYNKELLMKSSKTFSELDPM